MGTIAPAVTTERRVAERSVAPDDRLRASAGVRGGRNRPFVRRVVHLCAWRDQPVSIIMSRGDVALAGDFGVRPTGRASHRRW